MNDIYFELIPLVNFAIAGTHILIYIFAYSFFLFLSQSHSLFFFVCIRVRFVSCESTAIGKMQLATPDCQTVFAMLRMAGQAQTSASKMNNK